MVPPPEGPVEPVSSPARLPEPATATFKGRRRAPRFKWHVIYYLLAAFDFLTVSALLYLNHRSVGLYVRSVDTNQRWAQVMAAFADLGEFAAAVNAPGNDVFDSGDVALESNRMERALHAMQERLSALRAELLSRGPDAESGPLLEGIDEVKRATQRMAGQSRAIFAHFGAGRRVLAGQQMASMDRSYNQLLDALRALSGQVARIQAQVFARQTAAIVSVQRAEWAGAGLIVVMLTAAVVYGRKIARHFESEQRDRQRYIGQLQEVQETLRRAHAEMERRVEERTSALRESEAARHREERMSAMGSLIAGVAHEVRNPLFGISSTLDAFEARHGGRGEFDKYLKVLKNEVERLRTLMQDLLDYGKPPTLDLASVDVEELVREAVAACEGRAREAKVQIVKERWDLGRAALDRWRMLQVLQNLIQNAVQHSPAGGRVVLDALRSVEGGRSWLRIDVRDAGPGFEAEELRRVFEPFYTRRPGGTGLGLSIAQRIVAQHGGALSAANLPEGGALVSVRLPADGPGGSG